MDNKASFSSQTINVSQIERKNKIKGIGSLRYSTQTNESQHPQGTISFLLQARYRTQPKLTFYTRQKQHCTLTPLVYTRWTRRASCEILFAPAGAHFHRNTREIHFTSQLSAFSSSLTKSVKLALSCLLRKDSILSRYDPDVASITFYQLMYHFH